MLGLSIKEKEQKLVKLLEETKEILVRLNQHSRTIDFETNFSQIERVVEQISKFDTSTTLTKKSLIKNLEFVNKQEYVKVIERSMELFNLEKNRSIMQALSNYKAKYQNDMYKKYFVKIEHHIERLINFLKNFFIPQLSTIVQGGRYKSLVGKLINLLTRLSKELVFFEREVIQRIERSINILRNIEESLNMMFEELKIKDSKINNFQELIVDEHTFDGKIRSYKGNIIQLKHQIVRIDKYEKKLRNFFDEEYLKNNEIWKRRIPDQFIESMWKFGTRSMINESLEKYEKSLLFYNNFKKAYLSNDQESINQIVLERNKDNTTFQYNLLGTKSNIQAFSGIKTLELFEDTGSWHNSQTGESQKINLTPEQYAGRIAKILNVGLKPSNRSLDTPFCDLSKIQNIYFWDEPSISYGGAFATITWSCNGFCVFQSSTGISGKKELIIFTTKNIPPNKLKLLVTHPDNRTNPFWDQDKKIGNYGLRSFHDSFVKALQDLDIPFEFQ